MQDLNDLFYFVQTVEHQGFAPAGRALGMPKSRLSRRLALLEERLGVRLIQRSTRHFMVTDIGLTYYERCKAMLAEAEAAQEVIDAAQVEPRGVVKLTCPIALLHTHVGGMLADFMLKYPRVVIQLEATNRRVDVLGEAVDVAIRVRPPPLEDSELVMRVLADRGQSLVGPAPSWQPNAACRRRPTIWAPGPAWPWVRPIRPIAWSCTARTASWPPCRSPPG